MSLEWSVGLECQLLDLSEWNLEWCAKNNGVWNELLDWSAWSQELSVRPECGCQNGVWNEVLLGLELNISYM